MDTETLKAFIAVSETQSFSLAADRLHITQPACSKRIARLEQSLKTKVFDRIGKSVLLTQAGTHLLPRANAILALFEDTEREISSLSKQVLGTLSIGTSHHIGLHRLPRILRSFSKQFEQVKFDIHFMESETALRELHAGKLELALLTIPKDHPSNLISLPIWRDKLKFVCAPEHFLASHPEVSLRQLSQVPAILPDQSTYTGQLVGQLFASRDLSINSNTSTNHLESIKMLATIGLGWTVLPESMIDESLQELTVPYIDLQRDLGLMHLENRSLSSAATAFIKQAVKLRN